VNHTVALIMGCPNRVHKENFSAVIIEELPEIPLDC